jgi:hypothetical protein
MSRLSVFLPALALALFLSPGGASAADAPPPSAPPSSAQSNTQAPAATTCPAGTHWEPAGYIRDGKWRDARCAKDGGRE